MLAKINHSQCVTLILSLLVNAASLAAPLSPEQVPEPLQPWIDWVMHGSEQRQCPFLYNADAARRCAWPTRLQLDVDSSGARFTARWQVYIESWINIPGDARHWPANVRLNGRLHPVIERQGRPAVRVPAGEHLIAGQLRWPVIPESVSVPFDTALVEVSVNNEAISRPQIDAQGRLWLRAVEAPETKTEDSLHATVTRRFTDGIPVQQTVRIELDVAGKSREVNIGKPLLAGFVPIAISAPLPARIEPDGSLWAQLRPGKHVIEIRTRATGNQKQFELVQQAGSWPQVEYWSVSQNTNLRVIEIDGLPPVDPSQTPLPKQWHRLPSFKIGPGQSMQWTVTHRGDAEPQPDALTLHRTLWMDFDGGAWTFTDQIAGTANRSRRLESTGTLSLGQVQLNGKPQVITYRDDPDKAGVEIQRGALNARADGRIVRATRDVAASGWQQQFDRVETTVHLPPGWDLLATSGTEKDRSSWLGKWNLLDLFVVLLSALAALRLWGIKIAAAFLATLLLTWQLPNAPHYVWLNLLAATALWRVLPEGRFKLAAKTYRVITLLALVLIAVPFITQQLRVGFYPQLERPYQQAGTAFVEERSIAAMSAPAPTAPMETMDMMVADDAGAMMEEVVVESTSRANKFARQKAGKAFSGNAIRKQKSLVELDPDSQIQTGPGLPNWHWRSTSYSWQGPIASDHSFSMILVSPGVNFVVHMIRVALLIGLIAFILAAANRQRIGATAGASASVAALVLGLALMNPTQEVMAEIPGPEILNELKQRLTAPEDCLPQCASISELRIDLTGDRLRLHLQVESLADTAIPLPGLRKQWQPSSILLNGQAAGGLAADRQGYLWLQVPAGQHEVNLFANLSEQRRLQLSFPLPARHGRIDAAQGWDIVGVRRDGTVAGVLDFTRRAAPDSKNIAGADNAESVSFTSEFPPFVRVERILYFGLEWEVVTRVVRIAPANGVIVARVPLLPGEAVTTDAIEVENGHVQVLMASQQNVLEWNSTLEISEQLSLKAQSTDQYVETWQINASPIWHLEFDGIPPVHASQRNAVWNPKWQPWPGETLNLSVERPGGIAGNTLTIDSSTVKVTPSERGSESTLQLSLRSSRGGQYELALPAGAEPRSLKLNGASQPVRLEDGVMAVNLGPGTTQLEVAWNQEATMSAVYRTPSLGLGNASVNHRVDLRVPDNRWVLLTGGARLGPAVLIWGLLIVVAIVSVFLARLPIAGVRYLHWFLLGIGLTQVTLWSGVIVVAWFVLMHLRGEKQPQRNWQFNLGQMGLFVLTLVMLGILFAAVEQGLLGQPEMQVAGNGSSAYNMHWYADQIGEQTPSMRVISLPLYVYRALMLAWALWLAYSLLGWLRWAWARFNENGLWRPWRTRTETVAS